MLSGAVFCGECRFTHGLEALLPPSSEGDENDSWDDGEADDVAEDLNGDGGPPVPDADLGVDGSSETSDGDSTGADGTGPT